MDTIESLGREISRLRGMLNAQKALYKLGFLCTAKELPTTRNPEGMAYSIYETDTGRVVAASVNPDIFQTTAIAKTIQMLNNLEA